MSRAIVQEIDPLKIILFGSYAGGKASKDSDVDLLVVVESYSGDEQVRREQEVRLYRALSHLRPPQDIIVVSKEEIERWRDDPNHIIARAVRGGKVLYEKASARV